MNKTIPNGELVKRAKTYPSKNTVYIYGASGERATMAFAEKQMKAFKGFYTSAKRDKLVQSIKDNDEKSWAFDCSGFLLAVSVYGWDNGKIVGNRWYDSGADNMMEKYFENPKNLPDPLTKDWCVKNLVPGEALWQSGHIGLYIGDGLVIECTPTLEGGGVVQTKVEQRKGGYRWKKSGRLAWVEYSNKTSGFKTKTETISDNKNNQKDETDNKLLNKKSSSGSSISSLSDKLESNASIIKGLQMVMFFENDVLLPKINDNLNNADYAIKAHVDGGNILMGFGNMYANASSPYVKNGSSVGYKTKGKWSTGDTIVYDPKTKRTAAKQIVDLVGNEYFKYLRQFLKDVEDTCPGVDFSKMKDYELGAIGSLIYETGPSILKSSFDKNSRWAAAFEKYILARSKGSAATSELSGLGSIWKIMTTRKNRREPEFAFFSTGSTDIKGDITPSAGNVSSGTSSNYSFKPEDDDSNPVTYMSQNGENNSTDEIEQIPEDLVIDNGELYDDEILGEVLEDGVDLYLESEGETIIQNPTAVNDVIMGGEIAESSKDLKVSAKGDVLDSSNTTSYSTIVPEQTVNADGSINVSTFVQGVNQKNLVDVSEIKPSYKIITKIEASKLTVEKVEFSKPIIPSLEPVKIQTTVNENVGEKALANEELVKNFSQGQKRYVVHGSSLFDLFNSYLTFMSRFFAETDGLPEMKDYLTEKEDFKNELLVLMEGTLGNFTEPFDSKKYDRMFNLMLSKMSEKFKDAGFGQAYEASIVPWGINTTQLSNTCMYTDKEPLYPEVMDLITFEDETKEFAKKRICNELRGVTTTLGFTENYGFGFEMIDRYGRFISPASEYSVMINLMGILIHFKRFANTGEMQRYREYNANANIALEEKRKVVDKSEPLEDFIKKSIEAEKKGVKAKLEALKARVYGVSNLTEKLFLPEKEEYKDLWNLIIYLMLYYFMTNSKAYSRLYDNLKSLTIEVREPLLKSFSAFSSHLIKVEKDNGWDVEEEPSDKFEALVIKHKKIYKGIKYKMLFIRFSHWNLENNKVFSKIDEFLRYFSTGYNYSKKDSKSIPSALVKDLNFDRMQSIAKELRDDISEGAEFIHELITIFFVDTGILKNLKQLAASLDELGSSFELIKPVLFPKTPLNLKGTAIKAMLGAYWNTTILVGVNWLLNFKVKDGAFTPLEMYENLVTLNNVAKSIENNSGNDSVLNSFFKIQNDVFYKKAKNGGFGLYSINPAVAIPETQTKFIDLGYPDSFMKILSEKIAIDVNTLKLGNYTVESRFPFTFAFMNYIQYKYKFQGKDVTVLSDYNLFLKEYKKTTMDEFKIFMYIYYMKRNGGSWGVDLSIVDSISHIDSADKSVDIVSSELNNSSYVKINGGDIDIYSDRTWTSLTTTYFRGLYNYPEIEVYDLVFNYKKTEKMIDYRKKILESYDSKDDVTQMLTDKRNEMMEGVKYLFNNKHIFEDVTMDYIKSQRALSTLNDAYSKLYPSTEIILDAMGAKMEKKILFSDITDKWVNAIGDFIENLVGPLLKKQVEEMERLSMVMNFSEKEVKKFNEIEALKTIAEQLKMFNLMIDDFLDNPIKYNKSWFM